MPTLDPMTPATGGSPASAAGGTSFGPSLGASLAVHGAMMASLVFAFRAASPPVDRRGPSNFSAQLEAVEPRPPEEFEELEELPQEVLPLETRPDQRPLPDLDEFEALTPDPLSDVFADRPSLVPEPEPGINPFVDPLAILDGVRIRPIERPVVDPPRMDPPSVEPKLPPVVAAEPDPRAVDPGEDAADDVSPEPIADSCPPPIYPQAAERRGWKGTVVLLIDVAVDGSVTTVRIESSSGYSILDEAAVRAVEGWRFTPGRTGGAAAPATVRKPIQFGR